MNLCRVQAVIAGLQAQGMRVSVRNVHALTGGSFRDVSRILREVKAALEDDALAPAPVPPVAADDAPTSALPPCTVCQQTAWRPRYGDDVLECGHCRATALEVRAWLLRVQYRSATALELTLQHTGGVVTACGNPQEVRELSTLRSDQVVMAWGNLRRTGPSASDVVFCIVAICNVCRV